MSAEGREWAWSLANLVGPVELVVALAIGDYCHNGTDDTWPSLTTLTERTGRDRTTVVRAIARLRAGGHLIKVAEGGGRRSNTYRRVIPSSGSQPPLSSGSEPPLDEPSSGSQPPPSSGSQPRSSGSQPPEPLTKTFLNQKEEEKTRDELSPRRAARSSSSPMIYEAMHTAAKRIAARKGKPESYAGGIVANWVNETRDDGRTMYATAVQWADTDATLTAEAIANMIDPPPPGDDHPPDCPICDGTRLERSYVLRDDGTEQTVMISCRGRLAP